MRGSIQTAIFPKPAPIGRLFRDGNVVTVRYGRPLIEKAPIDTLSDHRRVRQVEEGELSVRDASHLLEQMA